MYCKKLEPHARQKCVRVQTCEVNVVFTPSLVTSGHLTPHLRPPPTDAPATRSSSRACPYRNQCQTLYIFYSTIALVKLPRV